MFSKGFLFQILIKMCELISFNKRVKTIKSISSVCAQMVVTVVFRKDMEITVPLYYYLSMCECAWHLKWFEKGIMRHVDKYRVNNNFRHTFVHTYMGGGQQSE